MQEIHYPNLGVMLQKMGYAGFVGHEFIPTRDAEAGICEVIQVCEVFEQFFMVSSGIAHNILWESAFEWAGFVAS